MMHDRIRQLRPAVDLAHEREDEAARLYRTIVGRRDEAKARLEQLRQFRAEYLTRFHDDGRSGLSARRVQDYHAFIAGLDHSVEQTCRQLEQYEIEIQQLHKRWLATRARTQALESVVERCRSEQRRVEDRREQAATDEFAAARHRSTSRPH